MFILFPESRLSQLFSLMLSYLILLQFSLLYCWFPFDPLSEMLFFVSSAPVGFGWGSDNGFFVQVWKLHCL